MKIERTTKGLRDVLFETLEDYIKGDCDAAHVSTIAKTANAILSTVNTDLNAAKTMQFIRNSGGGDVDFNLKLGSSRDEVPVDDEVMGIGRVNKDIRPTSNGYIHKMKK